MADGARKLADRYELHGELAAGGMATVHLGRIVGPAGFSRPIAIKRLHPHYAKDPDFVTMFMDEARLAARIRHRNVVPTLDVVIDKGELFLVMEHVVGAALSRLLTLVPKPPLAITAAIVNGVCHGLHAAHEARDDAGNLLKIVHRDVSPQNVMICEDGTARVVDFGVAKAIDTLHSTREGELKGKLPYMSVEQLEGKRLDRRVDVYAAAAVLWEMLVGRRLVSGSNDGAIVNAVLANDFDAPRKHNPQVSVELDEVTRIGLCRDRDERFDSCRAMAVALEESGPMATPREVADWLEEVAGSLVEESRNAMLLDAEWSQTAAVKPPQAAATPASEPDASPMSETNSAHLKTIARDKPSGRGAILMTAVVAALVAGGVVAVTMRSEVPDDGSEKAQGDVEEVAAPKASSSETSTEQALPAGPSAVATPTTAATGSARTSAASATSGAATPRPKVRPPAPTAAAPTAAEPTAAERKPPPDNCNPPYTVGADDVKRYKPWCL